MASSRIQLDVKQHANTMQLLKGVDRVELKLTVQDTDQRSAMLALDLDVLDADFHQVVFFDTPDLKLERCGVVVRARRIRKGGDTVVKLRPVVPNEIPEDLRHSGSFVVELDAAPGSAACSGSLKGKVDNSEVRQVLLGKRPVRKLFSREQRALYKKHAPKDLSMDSLSAFGPINVAKLKFNPQNFKRLMAAEVWFYPDGSRILELSTKCTPNEAWQVVAETRDFLIRRGISLTGKQEMKTREALHHFSHQRNGKRR